MSGMSALRIFLAMRPLSPSRNICQFIVIDDNIWTILVNYTILAIIILSVLVPGACPAKAGPSDNDTPLNAAGNPAWAKGSAAQATGLRGVLQGHFQALDGSSAESQPGPTPQTLLSRTPQGVAATYLPQGGIASTATEPFFQPLGTNGRTCQTCHQPSAGWTITPQKIKALFRSNPAAPLFQPIDGAVCPTADTSTAQATAAAYSLLINKGLIRVFIPMPAADILQFSITNVADPYDCTSNPATGLTSPTTGIVSAYRRPQPSANLPFLADIMWDGREPSLASQASDAVMLHAQGAAPPSADQLKQITQFETGLFAAQAHDNAAGDLTADGAQGGPAALSATPFAPNMNPPGPGFNPSVMTMFTTWNNSADAGKASVARGQNVFNEKSFTIADVAGLNDVTGKPSIKGTCSSCHNTPQIGNHSSHELLDLGVASAPASVPAGTNLSIADLPVFTVHCVSGPFAGSDRQVTDLGRALITGQCADIGKMKTALLRNLVARPPYFHNGSAPDLASVVAFYDSRFNIGITDQEKDDLIAFLSTL